MIHNDEKPRTSARIWLILGLLLLVTAIPYAVYTMADLTGWRGERSSFRVAAGAFPSGSVKVLTVDSPGSVTIIGIDSSDVSVDVYVRRGLRRPSASHRMAGDTLNLRGACPMFNSFCTVDYTVRLPRNTSVKVNSSGGDVLVSRLNGSVQLSSSGGGIRVAETTGTLQLSSSGGDIRADLVRSGEVTASSSGGGVRLSFIKAPMKVDTSSSGGDVRVEVPRDVTAYSVDASSSGGDTRVKIKTDPKSRHRVKLRSSGGGVTADYTSAE